MKIFKAIKKFLNDNKYYILLGAYCVGLGYLLIRLNGKTKVYLKPIVHLTDAEGNDNGWILQGSDGNAYTINTDGKIERL